MRKLIFLLLTALIAAAGSSVMIMAETNHIIINQAYGRADKTDAAISHSFIELYNPSGAEADLTDYSLQYAKTGADWIKLDLTGVTIPAKTSFLVRCYSADGEASRYVIEDYDKAWAECQINNDAFKIALVSNQVTLTTASPSSGDGVIDLLGAGTTDYAEGDPITGISKQKAARRISLSDTDNNSVDFEILDYRSTGISDETLENVRPHSLSDGVWEAAAGKVTIEGIILEDGVVKSMNVNIEGTMQQGAQGIAAIYDLNGVLKEADFSVDTIAAGDGAGAQTLSFGGGITLSSEETLKAFVWGLDDNGMLNLMPYSKGYVYEDSSGETEFIFTDGGVTVSGPSSGYTVSGTSVEISASGSYYFSGSCNDGNIVVTKDSGEVNIVLNGLSLTSQTTAPIATKGGTTFVTITVTDGTLNSLSDTDRGAASPKSAINASKALRFDGTGSLSVNGNNKNGIKSDTNVTVDGVTLTVNSVDNGIAADNILTLNSGNITVNSGGDSLKSSPDTGVTEELAGKIVINGGDITLISDCDGIQADGDLIIYGGNFVIETGGGSDYSPESSEDSKKGMKAGGALNVHGGTFSIDSSDDALHSNSTIEIGGGEFVISSGDDGVHADETLTVKGDGTKIAVNKSYEGLEATTINIEAGTVYITSTDDGINASGGADGSSTSTDRPGGGGVPGQGTGNGLINISGGYIVIDASGDGLDANGNITMSGGKVIVNGSTSSADAAIDYDGTFVMTGGFIVAAGSSGMAQAPGTSSTQRAVKITYKSTQAANTPVTIKNSAGSNILSFSPAKQYTSIVFCSPDIISGQTYTVYSGGTYTGGSSLDGLYDGGTLSGGTQKTSFTSSSVVMSVTIN